MNVCRSIILGKIVIQNRTNQIEAPQKKRKKKHAKSAPQEESDQNLPTYLRDSVFKIFLLPRLMKWLILAGEVSHRL
jgi:hypothetical protein